MTNDNDNDKMKRTCFGKTQKCLKEHGQDGPRWAGKMGRRTDEVKESHIESCVV